MEIGFDVIGGLDLSPDEEFDWENKATSLYCIITGNISSDIDTVIKTLLKLSQHYQGVFYNLGTLEYTGVIDSNQRTHELLEICKKIPRVAVLHHHVVIIDGVAIIGANGWEQNSIIHEIYASHYRRLKYEDIAYLSKSIEKLQKYLDVRKIIVVSNAVPNKNLYFGQAPDHVADDPVHLDYCLNNDTEMKVTHWAFGTYDKEVDTKISNINYISNPYTKSQPYWAKRIKIEI